MVQQHLQNTTRFLWQVENAKYQLSLGSYTGELITVTFFVTV